jgi:hypothetical protein
VGKGKLAVGTHYFWTAGTVMQKSQRGLLQTLLYDIFRMCPEELPKICPGLVSPSKAKEWSYEELLDTFRTVVNRTSASTKYCLFIDGIDEFEGDHYQLCRLLKDLSCSPNIKLCLSSRPWNVLEDAFGADSSRMLRIHDLTRQDILVYAQSRFEKKLYWSEN